MICVSLSIKNWPCLMALIPILLCLHPSGCQYRSGNGHRSCPGRNRRQKWTLDPYLRPFDANHRQVLAVCPSFSAGSMGILRSLKIGEVMSRSEIRAMICVRDIDVDSSIQAQGTGEFMHRKWRIYGNSDSLLRQREALRHEHSSLRRWQGRRRLQPTLWPVLDNLEQAREWNSCAPSIRPTVPHRP